MKQQQKAYACGLGTVLLWSTVGSAFKLSLRFMEPLQLLLYASLVSGLTLLGILAIQKKLVLLARFTPSEWLASAVYGLFNPFLYYVLLFEAYDRLPAQQAQAINYTWAITLTLLSIPLLKQKISLQEIVAITISYAGVVIISTGGAFVALDFSDPTGIFLALVTTVIWALYWILTLRDTRDPVAGLLANFLFGTVYIAVATAFFSDIQVDSLYGLAGAAYVGVFEMGIAFVLWVYALKLSENTAKVSNLIFLAPFVSLIFIYFILKEPIAPTTFIGLFCIIGGIILQQRQAAAKKSPSKKAS